MMQAEVRLVIPEPLIETFPASIRTDIVTLESVLGDLRVLSAAEKGLQSLTLASRRVRLSGGSGR